MSQNTDSPSVQPVTGDGASPRVLAVVLLLAVVIALLMWQLKRQQPTLTLHDPTLAPTPPAEILYRELPALKTGFAVSRGLALDQAGGLYLVGDQSVAYVDQHGRRSLLAQLPAPPRCLVPAGDGGFFVGLVDHVEQFDRRGVRLASWPLLGSRACLTSLALGKDGVLWVADAGNREVLGYARGGVLQYRLGRQDAARHIPGLVVPSAHLDVLVAADGTLLVTNPGLRQVEYYRPTGDLLRSWGDSSNADGGFAGCCNPTNIALLPDGRVVTSEKSIPRVKLYSATGRYLGMVAPPQDFRATAAGLALAVATDGRILVLDPTMNTVRTFVPKTGEQK